MVTLSPFEKLPEDIFNFDFEIVGKDSRKEKSILLSVMDDKNMSNCTNNESEKIRQNAKRSTVYNPLYEQDSLGTSSKWLATYERSIRNDVDNRTRITCKCKDGKNLKLYHICGAKMSKNEIGNENLLKPCMDYQGMIVENLGYDLFPCEGNRKLSNDEVSPEHTKDCQLAECDQSYQYLTGRDLLMFAKQIATGMVRISLRKKNQRTIIKQNKPIFDACSTQIGNITMGWSGNGT